MALHAPLHSSVLPPTDDALIAGQFKIVAPLDSSLTGRTWLGRHAELDQPVIIKLMHVGSSPTVRARFEREARALSCIAHPHVARLLAYGKTGDGRRYMVTEHTEGRTLRKVLQRWGRLPEGRALRVLDQIAQALEATHRAGLVHRNLKPESVVLGETRDGTDLVKLTNFGLVRASFAMDDRLGDASTRTGAMTGTPKYWAPEQVLGDTADARTDVYAFGVVAFEVLTGKSPFESTTTEGFAWQHVHQPPKLTDRQGRARLRPALEMIVRRCLAKHPDQRFATMTELREALRKARGAARREARQRTLQGRVKAQLRRPEVWVTATVAFLAGLLGALVG